LTFALTGIYAIEIAIAAYAIRPMKTKRQYFKNAFKNFEKLKS